MHAYPAQLADFVLDNWPADAPLELSRRALAELLSTCYQSSLVQEEGRTVRFRAVVAHPEQLAACRASERWLMLAFGEPRPFSADEARHASPAAPFQSTALGILVGEGQLFIWGVIQTGAHWLAPTRGGRALSLETQRFLMVQVLAPGRLAVYCGHQLIAALERGSIEATTTDVFTSRWLPRLFKRAREEVRLLAEQDTHGASFDEALIGTISQHMIRRAIFLIRSARHGGLLLCAETELGARCMNQHGPLKFKYSMSEHSDRGRYRKLLRQLLDALARGSPARSLGWQDFLAATNPALDPIERAIFEFSGFIAGLSGVDGAVVLDKRFEVMGFGAEVSGGLPYPDTVYQALDVEAERRSPEPATLVGTRHRAAYRFVTACPDGLAIVVSHDGAVRFVANLEGDVVYWEQFLNW